MSENLITAKFRFPGRDDDTEAYAVNPGAWFGKTWLIECGLGNFSFCYVVEADCLSDALDELAESERYGHAIAISDDCKRDYGEPVKDLRLWPEAKEKLDALLAGGAKLDDIWIDLNGELRTEPLAEYHTSGQGVPYDTDNVMAYGQEGVRNRQGMPFPCLYFGPGLPQEGISPIDF